MPDEEVLVGVKVTGQDQLLNLGNSISHLQDRINSLTRGIAESPQTSTGVEAALSQALLGQFSRLDEVQNRLAGLILKDQELARKIALTTRYGFRDDAFGSTQARGIPGTPNAGQFLPSPPVGTKPSDLFRSQPEIDAALIAQRGRILVANRTGAAVLEQENRALEQALRMDNLRAEIGRIVADKLGQQAAALTTATNGTRQTADAEQQLRAAIAARAAGLKASQLKLDTSGLPGNVVAASGVSPSHQAAVQALLDQGRVPSYAEVDAAVRGVPGKGFSSGALLSNSYIQQIHDAITKALTGVTQAMPSGTTIAELTRVRDELVNATRLASAHEEFGALTSTQTQPYPNPDTTTHLGIAQRGVNDATLKQELAQRNYTSVLQSDTFTVEKGIAAQLELDAAQKRLAGATDELALLTTRQSGSFAQQFRTGFRGANVDRGYAEQIGQAFKFSLLYGSAYQIMFAIQQSLKFALTEGINFQEAMTELSIASGHTAAEMNDLRVNVSQTATQYGLAPSEGVRISARSLGLFGVAQGSGATLAQQNQVAEISTRAVSQASFASGLNPEDVQRDLAAIAQAFGQGAAGQTRAFDLDAYLSRRLGSGPGSTYAAVAQSATAGAAAGFSQEQVTAIAAVLQARTGQDATTVAGYMAQLFSRSGQGSLIAIEGQYGVDTSQSLAGQIRDLRKIYQQNPSERDNISAVFGRGKSQNASIALLQSFPEAMKAAADAIDKAVGAGDKTVDLKLGNVSGQLAVFGGDLKAFASELGQSGLLDVLGLLLKTLDALVKAATSTLQLFDAMDPALKGLVSVILGATLAIKASSLVGGLIPGAAGRGAAAISEEEALALEAGAVGATAGRAGVLAKVASLGRFIPAAALTGDVLAVSSLRSAENKINSTDQQAYTTLTTSNLTQTSTPAQIEARAAQLHSDANAAHDAMHTFWGSIIQFAERNKPPIEADRLESDRLTALAKANSRLAAEQARNYVPPVIQSFDATGIAAGLQAVADNGGNAREQLDALSDAIDGTASASTRAANRLHPSNFAANAADPIQQLFGKVGAGIDTSGSDLAKAFYGPLADIAPKGAIGRDVLQSAVTPTDIQARLSRALSTLGVNRRTDITPKVAAEIAPSVVGDTAYIAGAKLGWDPQKIAAVQDKLRKAVEKYLLGQSKALRDLVDPHKHLSDSQLTAAVNTYAASLPQILSLIPTSDHNGRINAIQRVIGRVLDGIKHHDGATPSQTQDTLDALQRQLADEQIAKLEDLRKAAQAAAGNDRAAVARIGKGFLTREINIAVRAQDQDKLVELIGLAGKYGIAIAKNAVDKAIQAAEFSIKVERDIQAFTANELGALGHIGQVARTGGANANTDQVPGFKKLLNSILNTAPSTDSADTYKYGTLGPPPTGSTTPGPTAAQIAAARQSAYASGSESAISTARAALATARADMAAAKKGTVEYYSALGAYLSARNDLTAAIQEYHANLYLLSHDATNPIVQAQAAVRAAAAKLRADAGKPADVRAADRVALQSAQASAESTRFSQRLQDAQTAESLGRISHTAYIAYLDHEHDRLEQIKHRSYQQQQELNQVDQLLKDASDSMQGIFNFGDINLPKPYQVKRYIEQKFGGATAVGIGGGQGQAATQIANTIHINGADTAMVLRVLKDYLGNHVHLDTTTPRKR